MEIKLSVSAGKKSNRSKFLSALMKKFSGDIGDKAVAAFADANRDELLEAFAEAAQSLADDFENA